MKNEKTRKNILGAWRQTSSIYSRERMVVTNVSYKLPPRRIYGWKAPQDTGEKEVRNKVDQKKT